MHIPRFITIKKFKQAYLQNNELQQTIYQIQMIPKYLDLKHKLFYQTQILKNINIQKLYKFISFLQKNQMNSQDKAPSSSPLDQIQSQDAGSNNNTGTAIATNNTQSEQILNQEEVRIQLKEKLKQNKTLEAKNKKLQAKYIELFKEQKALKKDWGVLTATIKMILPELQDRGLGRYDSEQLKEHWNTKQGKMIRKIQQLQQEIIKIKEKAESQASQLAQQKIDKVIRQSKQKVQSVNKQLQSFKKNTKNLSDQLSDYDKKLQSKSEQVSKLTKEKLKLEHQINQLKMKSITDELVADGKADQQNKITNQRNQILGLKHQIQQLMQKRDELRAELKNSKALNQKLKLSLEQKDRQLERVIEESKVKKRLSHQEVNFEKKISISSDSDVSKEQRVQQSVNQHHLIDDDDYIHREYMKNVFIRYMKSWTKGDNTQAEVLLNIIETILKFTHVEKQMLAQKKKSWWGLY